MKERVQDGNQMVSNQNARRDQREKGRKVSTMNGSFKLRELTIIGLLAGITLALGFSGNGIIPLGPLNVTTLHVPALIGALVEGPKVGAFVGLIFGCYSLWQNITAPNILSPLFYNPLISVLPRILFPILAWLIYKALWKVSQGPKLIIASFLGTALHTIMVMGLIFLLYADMFGDLMKLSTDQIVGTIVFLGVTHGIPEAIFAGVIVTPVVLALRKVLGKDKPKKQDATPVTGDNKVVNETKETYAIIDEE
ncbi:ECF transporter S component [Veillonella agrestimuris]|uniref:ECF transporter S component n=1 Tax=Veillonella agrestimuris TaxID=2941340 RepID=UPI002040C12C|nr:ECF transporter S component [Veillonella agrestimuris]